MPAGYVCLTRPEDLVAYRRALSLPQSATDLAVLVPADLGWSAVVSNTPDALGPDGSDPLVEIPWLTRFRAVFGHSAANIVQSDIKPAIVAKQGNSAVESGPPEVVFTVPGYRVSPSYDPGPPRSLYLPVTVQGSDGGVWTALYQYVARTGVCVQVSACVSAGRYDAVASQFRALANSVRLVDQPRPEQAKAASASPPPAHDDPDKLSPSAYKVLFALVIGVITVILRAGLWTYRMTSQLIAAITGPRRRPTSPPMPARCRRTTSYNGGHGVTQLVKPGALTPAARTGLCPGCRSFSAPATFH